jgi:integrase
MNRGLVTTTEPLKTIDDVMNVREVLQNDPRGFALFALGVNSALRASDILKLKRTDLKGNELFIREKKTRKMRRITLNAFTVGTLEAYLATRTDVHEWMFVGQRGKMTHGYFGKLVKTWFVAAGVPKGQYATHSLRKTFVRLQHEIFGVSLGTLMTCLNHSTEAQTLQYVGLNADDVATTYANQI